jgi:hypothetical protein
MHIHTHLHCKQISVGSQITHNIPEIIFKPGYNLH